MGISMNGPSGIDTAYIVESLVSIERNRVYSVEARRDDYQVKIDAYAQLRSLLSEVSSSAKRLMSDTDFNLFTTKSSN